MRRDKADVRERLQQAALDLYRDQGFDRTTTAQIARRADVTERTFFRHFADKREVLFDGEEALQTILATGIAEAPLALDPLGTLFYAFSSIEPLLVKNRAFSEPRQHVIAATPALQERELGKISSLADSLTHRLIERGVSERVANMTAKIGIVALVDATNAWLADGSMGFADQLKTAFADLRYIASASISTALQAER